jgi:hypothetical protein
MARMKRPEPQPKDPAKAEPAPPSAPTPAGSCVVLVEMGVNKSGVRCPAGTVIGPNVEGWPEHRVQAHLRDGRAKHQ